MSHIGFGKCDLSEGEGHSASPTSLFPVASGAPWIVPARRLVWYAIDLLYVTGVRSSMVFIETDSFNKAITALMPDEAYARLQQALVDDPELGDLIPGTGGMRKVRWTLGRKGKRGGARVIYFWRDRAEQIIFLMVYGKGVKTYLTVGEKRQLKQAAEALK